MILDVFNKNFVRIENISSYSYAEYNKLLNAAGDFEIRISLDDTAYTIIKSGVFILFEKDTCGIITFLEPTVDEESGDKQLTIKGYLSNVLLARRCIASTVTLSGTVTNVVRGLITSNFVSPTDSKRAMPIVLSTNPTYIPSSRNISSQITGGTVQEEIEKLLGVEEMGYDLPPILSGTAITSFEFRVIAGKNKTIGNQQGNDPVVFSSNLKNILTSTYTYNNNDYKNVAYVAGEGEGSSRTIAITGDNASTGLDRYELYVDARDLQSTDENNNPISPATYTAMLIERGDSKLKENVLEETYVATINQINTQYKFGVDYNLGDLVTIIDPTIDVSLNARVTQIQAVSLGERSILNVTFGYYKLSTKKKLRRNGVI